MTAFVALALFTAACSSTAGISGDWQLESGSIDGRAIPVIAGHEVTLSAEGSTFVGNGPCNRYGFEATTAGGVFKVGQIGSTAMLCSDAQLMASEEDYFKALRGGALWAVVAGRLVLCGEGVELRFIRLVSTPSARS